MMSIIKKLYFLAKNIQLLRIKLISFLYKKDETHQIKNSTSFDRYPEIFSQVCKYSETNNYFNSILSYGCSTGEECLSIRKYWPEAKIVGYDIDQKNIKIAKNRIKDNKIKFLNTIPQFKKFDLIFCMSVLCMWPQVQNLENINRIYSFNRFNKKVIELDRLLNKGGVLVIFNSNYLFEGTSVFQKYRRIKLQLYEDVEIVQKFDVSGNRIPSPDNMYFYSKL